jgi:hypothetical protein
MAQFPIQKSSYSPSGTVGAVQAHLNVDTGAELIGQAIERLGNQGIQFAEKMQDAKDTVETSTMKRKYDETMFKAHQVASMAPDDKVANDILVQAQKDVEGIQSKSGRVNNAFKAHVNNTMGQWEESFATQALGIKKRNVKDESQINIEAHLKTGALSEAAKEYAHLQAFGIITPAEMEQSIKELPAESQLVQANDSLISDPVGTMAKLEAMDTKNMTESQVTRMESLRTKARVRSHEIRGDLGKQIFNSITTNEDKPLAERTKIGAQLLEGVVKENNLTLAEAKSYKDTINDFVNGKKKEPDYATINQFDHRLADVKAGVSDPSLNDDILSAAQNGALDAGTFKRMSNEMADVGPSLHKQIISDAVKDFEKDKLVQEAVDENGQGVTARMAFAYSEALRQYSAANPNATPEQLFVQSRQLATVYRSMTTGATTTQGGNRVRRLYSPVLEQVAGSTQPSDLTVAERRLASTAAKRLDAATAQSLLREAGGNKDKARQLARSRGYTF